jgi:predicted metal-dependent HD superfamily phosphohydrolase
MAQHELVEKLRGRWRALMASLAVDSGLEEELFQEIVKHYGREGRHYHTLKHVYNVLTAIERLRGKARDMEAILLAAWYHDIIYEMKGGDNELRSAELAGVALRRMGVGQERITAIQTMIHHTDVNKSPPDDTDCQILLDADLSKLASSGEEYAQNSEAIRQEYFFVPEPEYRESRRRLLIQFLERNRIFQTDHMFANCEEKARRNIANELERLDQGMEE